MEALVNLLGNVLDFETTPEDAIICNVQPGVSSELDQLRIQYAALDNVRIRQK